MNLEHSKITVKSDSPEVILQRIKTTESVRQTEDVETYERIVNLHDLLTAAKKGGARTESRLASNEKRLNEIIDKIQKDFIAWYDSNEVYRDVFDICSGYSYLLNDAVREWVDAYGKEVNDPYQEVHDLVLGKMRAGSLARSEFVEFLRGVNRYKEQLWWEEEELFEKTKEEFLQEVVKRTQDRTVPLGLSKDEIKRKLADLTMSVPDLLYLPNLSTKGKHAANYISITPLVADEPTRRHVTFHELLHHLKGGEEVDELDRKNYGEVKSGLEIRTVTSDGVTRSNTWIDEGFVEWGARLLSGKIDTGHNEPEVQAIEELMQAGIPRIVFCAAFRENSLGGDGEQVSAYKTLLASIVELKGQDWMDKKQADYENRDQESKKYYS